MMKMIKTVTITAVNAILRSFRMSIVGVLLFALPLSGQDKQSLAILDFEAAGISTQEVTVLMNRLRTNLVSLDIYIVVERGQMLQILEEQQFTLTGCTSDECAVEVGQLLNAQLILAGNIGRLGNTWTLDARVIDVQTGRVTKTASFDTEGTLNQLLSEGIPELARRIAPGFSILGPEGAKVSINGEVLGNLPMERMYYPAGTYMLEVTMPEFYKYRMILTLTGREELTIHSQMRPKSKLVATTFSTVLPGTGQLYQGYQTKGIIYLVLAAGTGALSYLSHLDYQTAYEEYQDDLADYNQESDPDLWQEKQNQVDDSLTKARNVLNQRNTMFGITGAVWAVNIFSIVF